MMINSSAGLLTVCGRHVALWRTPLPRFLSTRSSACVGIPDDPKKNNLDSTPPIPVLRPGFQPTGMNKDGVYMGSTFLMHSPHTLPELDVSPLLNKTIFTRKVGVSLNEGKHAAVKLSKAKNELRDVIHQELEETMHDASSAAVNQNNSSSNNDAGGVKKMYIMRRHGVPNQLLQHLVTAADQWLEQKSALELWVDSSCQSSFSVLTTEGTSWRSVWQPEQKDDVALCLASMQRMVSQLGSMTPFCDGSSVLPGDLDWRLSISRENKLPTTLFPNGPNGEVFPVIEWATDAAAIDSNAASDGRRVGKIMIRMQGAPKPFIPMMGQGFEQPHDVSLIFEADFEIDAEEIQAHGK